MTMIMLSAPMVDRTRDREKDRTTVCSQTLAGRIRRMDCSSSNGPDHADVDTDEGGILRNVQITR